MTCLAPKSYSSDNNNYNTKESEEYLPEHCIPSFARKEHKYEKLNSEDNPQHDYNGESSWNIEKLLP